MLLDFSHLKNYRQLAIVSHVSPDGDALGSALALHFALAARNIRSDVILPTLVSDTYAFLPGVDKIIYPDEIAKDYQAVISVDATDPSRVGDAAGIVRDGTFVVNIDHHISNSRFGSVNILDFGAAATGEMILSVIEENKVALTKDMATLLYVAICTDTGAFTFSNVTEATHLAVAKLVAAGIDVNGIHRKLYCESSMAYARLLGLMLTAMKSDPDGRIIWSCVTREMFEAAGATGEDAEGLIDYLRDIQGGKIVALLRESDSGIRVSLRCVEGYNVNELAAAFGGGGHALAAGITMDMSLSEAEEKIVNAMRKAVGSGAQ
ncbi:MAG: DHH family phosphoesterase [Christensenellales bacterium]|jgi:phosphoesterase RecJ-like protein